MRRKLSLLFVLFAWLLATGSQWDCAQVLAWGRMIAHYSQLMPLTDAVRLTFTPGNECNVCLAVGEAKKQQDDPATPDAKAPGKILLVFQPVPVVIVATPSISLWSPSDQFAPDTMRSAPPVPPPRAA